MTAEVKQNPMKRDGSQIVNYSMHKVSESFRSAGSYASGQPDKAEMPKERNPQNAVSGMYYGARTFGSDLYNGVTGVVVDPYRGAKQGGVKGMAKGVGKGLIGLFFKPMAGTVSMINYTGSGLANTPGTMARGIKGKLNKKKVHKFDRGLN